MKAQTQQQVKLQERIEKAMSTLKIYDDEFGIYAVCPSTSGTGDVYLIEIDPQTMYSTSCTCPARGDCLHLTVCDMKLSDRRPSFSAMCGADSQQDGILEEMEGILAYILRDDVEEVSQPLTTIGEAMTSANETMQSAIADEAQAGDKSYADAYKPLDEAYAALAVSRDRIMAEKRAATADRLEAAYVETVAHIEQEQSQAGTCRYCGRMARKDICPTCAGC